MRSGLCYLKNSFLFNSSQPPKDKNLKIKSDMFDWQAEEMIMKVKNKKLLTLRKLFMLLIIESVIITPLYTSLHIIMEGEEDYHHRVL